MRPKNDKFIGFRMASKDVYLLDKVAVRDQRTRTGLIKYVLAQYIRQTVTKDAMDAWLGELENAS